MSITDFDGRGPLLYGSVREVVNRTKIKNTTILEADNALLNTFITDILKDFKHMIDAYCYKEEGVGFGDLTLVSHGVHQIAIDMAVISCTKLRFTTGAGLFDANASALEELPISVDDFNVSVQRRLDVYKKQELDIFGAFDDEQIEVI